MELRTDSQMPMVQQYQRAFTQHLEADGKPTEHSVRQTVQWFGSEGRAMYVSAFNHETALRIGATPKRGLLLEQAFPKGWTDYEKKASGDKFYQSNAEIFLHQMSVLLNEAPPAQPAENWQQRHEAIKSLLLSSVALLQEWGANTQHVPDVYDVWGNGVDPFYRVYADARALSRGEAIRSGHSLVSLLRTAIELRLRWAFGVLGSVDPTGGVAPVGLSKLLREIRKHKDEDGVLFAVPFDHIDRVYGWCNLYMHVGLKLYEWSPRFALDYLAPLFGPQEYGSGGRSVYAGIQVPRAVFDDIRATLKKDAKEGAELVLVKDSRCQIILKQ